jgi:preprotein translocase subunit SecD
MGESNGTGGSGTRAVVQTGDNGTELVSRMQTLEREAVQHLRLIEAHWVKFAAVMVEFVEQRGWKLCDCDTLQEWLASIQCDMGERHVEKLVHVYRELVKKRGVPEELLSRVSQRRMIYALPAVTKHGADPQEVIASAEVLSYSDFNERWKGDPNKPLDAMAEPEKARCPTCRSYVPKDRIRDEAA